MPLGFRWVGNFQLAETEISGVLNVARLVPRLRLEFQIMHQYSWMENLEVGKNFDRNCIGPTDSHSMYIFHLPISPLLENTYLVGDMLETDQIV